MWTYLLLALVCCLLLVTEKYPSGRNILLGDIEDIGAAWSDAGAEYSDCRALWTHTRRHCADTIWKKMMIDIAYAVDVMLIMVGGAISSTATCMRSAVILGMLIWNIWMAVGCILQ